MIAGERMCRPDLDHCPSVCRQLAGDRDAPIEHVLPGGGGKCRKALLQSLQALGFEPIPIRLELEIELETLRLLVTLSGDDAP